MHNPEQQAQQPPEEDEDPHLADWEQQRAQVAAHLRWLDARIEEMRAAGLRVPASAPADMHPPGPEIGPSLPENKSPHRAERELQPSEEAEYPRPPSSSPQVAAGQEAFAPISPKDFENTGDRAETLRSARFGCTILGALAIGGTIFFFFVLPYWIFR